MELDEWQKKVDVWIKDIGVRYFDELTNLALLMEETGELARLVARKYGEQNFKSPKTESEISELIQEEIADIFFVLTCLANQMNINLKNVLERNMLKKNQRDATRHIRNPKLK